MITAEVRLRTFVFVAVDEVIARAIDNVWVIRNLRASNEKF